MKIYKWKLYCLRVKWNVAWFAVYSYPYYGKFQVRFRSYLVTVEYPKVKRVKK